MTQRLQDEVSLIRKIAAESVIHHVSPVDPHQIAAALHTLAKTCHAIAAVMIDHPIINQAIDELRTRNVPVIALLSDVSSPALAGSIGVNDWQIGRCAGWFMDRHMLPAPRYAVISGHDMFRCQQTADAGFRSYISSEKAQASVLPTFFCNEDDATAFDLTQGLLAQTPAITGVFVSGGGIDGVLGALERHRGPKPLVVAID
ncbi:substrate-binding domain-containing protein [Thioclava sp. SK-1]|uniref:substrate-binding domain-containing protein n=1 Tax=Thioclava sp. SK-1 TaxID=1889770 RepID=UPI00159F1654|nr:substrate-binding domain-containing protein [Thioclava sp. SK-1]